MKKEYLLISVLGVLAFGSVAYTAPRSDFAVSKEYTNNGNTRQGFAVSVTSSAWVEVLPASVTRRFAVVHATSTSITEVCFSTTNAAATVCSASLPGKHMPYFGIVFEDHNEAAVYARGIGAATTIGPTSILLLGEKQYDSGD